MADSERPDLGALLHRLLVTVHAREEPILRAHDLFMWDYVVLTALAQTAAPTQAQLATATGRDKTRLIGNLDRLEAMQLLARRPDPSDRRNRIITLTPKGRSVFDHCRSVIRAMESDLLAGLPAARRITLLQDLAMIAPTAPR